MLLKTLRAARQELQRLQAWQARLICFKKHVCGKALDMRFVSGSRFPIVYMGFWMQRWWMMLIFIIFSARLYLIRPGTSLASWWPWLMGAAGPWYQSNLRNCSSSDIPRWDGWWRWYPILWPFCPLTWAGESFACSFSMFWCDWHQLLLASWAFMIWEVEGAALLNVEGVRKYCGCGIQLSRVWRTSPEICVWALEAPQGLQKGRMIRGSLPSDQGGHWNCFLIRQHGLELSLVQEAEGSEENEEQDNKAKYVEDVVMLSAILLLFNCTSKKRYSIAPLQGWDFKGFVYHPMDRRICLAGDNQLPAA